MFSRSFALGFAAASLLAAGLFLGVQLGSTKRVEAAPQTETRPLRAGYVCMSELTSDYDKWQARMAEHNGVVAKEAKRLEVMRGLVESAGLELQSAAAEDREERTGRWQAAAKKYNEAATAHTADVQKKAIDLWAELYADVSSAVRQIADERQLDVVYAFTLHPDRPVKVAGFNPEHKGATLLGKEQTQPLYLRDEVDLTAELVKRLNAKADREKK